MEALCIAPFNAVKSVLPQPLFLVYPEVVSFLAAVLGVWVITRVPRTGKLLFLYK